MAYSAIKTSLHGWLIASGAEGIFHARKRRQQDDKDISRQAAVGGHGNVEIKVWFLYMARGYQVRTAIPYFEQVYDVIIDTFFSWNDEADTESNFTVQLEAILTEISKHDRPTATSRIDASNGISVDVPQNGGFFGGRLCHTARIKFCVIDEFACVSTDA